MLKLIIVDDESMTRQGLAEYFPWGEFGVKVAETAEDGEKAYELIKSIRPDILLCDVRMPRMNGIELSTRVREILPECKIIFLSGYSDKEYLKSAIQLKAVDYIEKPIDLEEIKKVMQKTIDLISSENKKKQEIIKIELQLRENTLLLGQKLAVDLANNCADPDTFNNEFSFLHEKDRDAGFFETVVIQIHPGELNTLDMIEQNKDRILFSMKEYLNGMSVECCFGFGDTRHIILHLYNFNFNDLILKNIKLNLADILKNDVDISSGVGEKVNSMNGIRHSYQTASKALQKQFYTGLNKVIYYSKEESTSYSFDENTAKLFCKCLEQGKEADAASIIKDLLNDIPKYPNTDIGYVRNIFFTLLMEISKVINENNIPLGGEYQEKNYWWKIISELDTLRELGNFLINKLHSITEGSKAMSNPDKIVYDISQYIQKHYDREELSLKDIGEYVYLTPNYLCLVFKKKTGKTINQYITEIRIEKSKDHLRDRRTKLFEVAQKVGYSDPNYYAKMFKKLTDCTPSEYRKKYIV